MTDRIVHVSVENASQGMCEKIGESLGEDFPHKEIVVTDESMSIHEMPEVDEFVDEIVERIATSDELGQRIAQKIVKEQANGVNRRNSI